MDCYYHNAVPSVATCRDCARTVCATCRGTDASCPSCRLAARLDAASGARDRIGGSVGPSSPPPPFSGAAGPQPHVDPQPQPQPQPQPAPSYAPSYAPAVFAEPVETRALVALGYPFWPLAALALLTPRGGWAHRQAKTALGFNFGAAGLACALGVVAHVPLLGVSAWPLLALIPFVWLLASIVYAIKAAHGDDVRVPIVSDWLEERDRTAAPRTGLA